MEDLEPDIDSTVSDDLDLSDRPLMDFVDALGDGRSLLYVQARLLLMRLSEVLGQQQLLDAAEESQSIPAAPDAELAPQAQELARLMRCCGLHAGWEAGGTGRTDSGSGQQLVWRGVRLLSRLSPDGTAGLPPLLLSLAVAIDSATSDADADASADASAAASSSGQRVWADCLKFAAKDADAVAMTTTTDDDSDDVYSVLKREVQGAQCFFPIDSRRIQQALILLECACQQ